MRKTGKQTMEEKTKNQKQQKTENKKRSYSILTKTVVCMLALTIGCGLFVHYQMKRYERGILDVCATQQDAYVQLVLDQINLKQNRDDEDIIKNILGTLDASTNKYWTFSKDQAMLFVKDVLETNKYKGFTTATYYSSESAEKFLKGLQMNHVTHGDISIGERDYIASGVMFTYGGSKYRLCLLTNSSVLLDNNKFLGAKTELYILIAAMLLLLLLIPIAFAGKQRKLLIQADQKEKEIETLNNTLLALNERISRRDLHNTRSNLWKQETLPGFIRKLQERGVSPVTVAYLNCTSLSVREHFLAEASYFLSEEVLRFAYGESDLVLLFVQIPKADVLAALKPILPEGVKIRKCYDLEKALARRKERIKDGD